MEGKKGSLVVNRQRQGSKASDVSSTWILKSLRTGLLWGRGGNYRPKSTPRRNQEARTGSPTVTVRTRRGIAAGWVFRGAGSQQEEGQRRGEAETGNEDATEPHPLP